MFEFSGAHGRREFGADGVQQRRLQVLDADAPQEVKDFLRIYYMRYSGPAGMTEQDDIENWESATKQSLGGMGRGLPFNYAQGLGESEACDLMPGAVWCGRTITAAVGACTWRKFTIRLLRERLRGTPRVCRTPDRRASR